MKDPLRANVNNRYTYLGDNSEHAEQKIFKDVRNLAGDLHIDMNAWPCTNEGNHDCHALFQRQSTGRRITVNIVADKGGYAASHGKIRNSTGTIIYNRGQVTYV